MSPKLQPVRGTHDILPDEFEKFHAVVTLARKLAILHGFREMATPIFETTDVFARSMGETSDVVSKEMFTFQTKGEESVTLRPEFTAGTARAFISNGMQQHLPLKLFSAGPLFRYERPQKGRQRQFHQVNFEWLGDANPEADVQLIMLAGQLLYYLADVKGTTLHINTLGDIESRTKYREALVQYLEPYKNSLSEDSQRRLITNPLRILDSKDIGDQKIAAEAPKIFDYLTNDAKRHFEVVCAALHSTPAMQEIKIMPSLVRGLDYYTGTVFEFVANTGNLGTQNTVLAGGRYDGLIELMGGNPTPAIGFAAGIERLQLLIGGKYYSTGAIKHIYVVVLPFDEVPTHFAVLATAVLRNNVYELVEKSPVKCTSTVELLRHGAFKKRLKRASEKGATHVVIIGPDELKNDQLIIKDMITGHETKIKRTDITYEAPLIQLLGIPQS